MHSSVTRQRVGHGAIFAGSLFVTLLSFLFVFTLSTHAATGINQQLNYQARLLDNTGAAVPDGTYNMEFKIYQDGNGVLGGGDETLKWTETRTGGDKVTVKNGYFSVQLGSVTGFGASVDWNQDTLWLSTNIGGTGTPTWDGEMSPFRRMAASPYALNSNQLGGLTAAQFLQIAPSGVQVDATTSTSIFLNKNNGTGNLLQLQKSGVDVLSINNTGLATFSNGISVAGDTITDFTGNGLVVSSNALSLRLDTTAADGSSVSSVSGLEFVGGELSLIRGCDAGQVLQWDNSNFEWDCATISGGSGYATIQEEATPLTQRTTLNFTGAGVTCVDNAGSTRTDCTISGGGSSTLQQAYDAGSAGDQVIALDNTQDSVTFRNPSSSGTDSGYVLSVDQLNTGAVDGLRISSLGTGALLKITDSTSTAVDVLTVADEGAVTFKNRTDSTTAFTVQKTGTGVELFQIDSTNSRVYIGDTAADDTGVQLVLDTKNGAGDPTSTADGAMYYNSDSKNFRCRHNGLWQDCDFASLRSEWVLQEDFANISTTTLSTGSHGWTGATIGTGGTAGKENVGGNSSNYDRFGVLRLSSAATTASTGWNIRLDTTGMTGVPSNMTVEFDFAPLTANAALGTEQVTRIGLHNGTNSTTAPTDGMYFQYSATTTAGNWSRCTQATCVDTGVARTTTAQQYQRFKIVTNSAGTAVEFFINEASVGTASTNLPGTSSTDVYGPSITSYTLAAPASVKQWKMDYFQIKRNLTTLR